MARFGPQKVGTEGFGESGSVIGRKWLIGEMERNRPKWTEGSVRRGGFGPLCEVRSEGRVRF